MLRDEIEVRRTFQFLYKIVQLADERLLPVDLFLQPLHGNTTGAELRQLTLHILQPPLLHGEFILRIPQGLVERVPIHSRVVNPDRVVLLCRLEEPVNGCFSPALGVALHMVVPEPACGGFAEVVPQGLHPEDLAGLLLDGIGPIAPDNREYIADAGDDVVGMPFVIDKDAVCIDCEGVVSRNLVRIEWQTVLALEHPGGAGGEGCKGVWEFGRFFLADGVADVPAAEDGAEDIGKNTANIIVYITWSLQILEFT